MGLAPLNSGEIDAKLGAVPGWRKAGTSIEKRYLFPAFSTAVEFVNRVAKLADACDHHPDITITYRKVQLTLTTHSEGGITEKDFALAGLIESMEEK